ncbi:hypothetical protein BV20DRAFT_812195 [Pilatotrama ljubarskyi]|nr:hypothetical protein BV20DRAFT_812195 [Pilatotrama ljubarskyi]
MFCLTLHCDPTRPFFSYHTLIPATCSIQYSLLLRPRTPSHRSLFASSKPRLDSIQLAHASPRRKHSSSSTWTGLRLAPRSTVTSVHVRSVARHCCSNARCSLREGLPVWHLRVPPPPPPPPQSPESLEIGSDIAASWVAESFPTRHHMGWRYRPPAGEPQWRCLPRKWHAHTRAPGLFHPAVLENSIARV